MNISNVNYSINTTKTKSTNNKPSFQAIHYTKRAAKALGANTAHRSWGNISDCSKRFEVLIDNKWNKDWAKLKEKTEWGELIADSCLIGCAGMTLGMLAGVVTGVFASMNGITFASPVADLFGACGAGFALATIGAVAVQIKQKINELRTLVVKAGTQIEGAGSKNPKLKGFQTNEYRFYDGPEYSAGKILENELSKKAYEGLEQVLANPPKHDSVEDFEKIMNDKIVKDNFANGMFFNFIIDDDGNTLLTKFFDIVPTEAEIPQYKKLLEKMEGMESINYNQIDSMGISVAEKIFNAENKDALELILSYPIKYLPELDDAFNNINDKDFKKRVGVMNIQFDKLMNALASKSKEDFIEESKVFESPLCNKDKLAKQIIDYDYNNTYLRDFKTKKIYPYLQEKGWFNQKHIQRALNIEKGIIDDDPQLELETNTLRGRIYYDA